MNKNTRTVRKAQIPAHAAPASRRPKKMARAGTRSLLAAKPHAKMTSKATSPKARPRKASTLALAQRKLRSFAKSASDMGDSVKRGISRVATPVQRKRSSRQSVGVPKMARAS
jgi:hypothetical protein